MIRSLLALTALCLFWVAPAFAVQFDHTAHLGYLEESTCATCHVVGAEAIKPEEKVCLECHEADFVDKVTFLGLSTHGPVWALEHRASAKGSAVDCTACHEQNFCLECHSSGYADEQGDLGNAMINVHRSDFHVTHPVAARTNPQLCASCHENRFCSECHQEFAPGDLSVLSHRRGWSDLSVSGTAHANFSPDSCQTCHPGSVLPAHEWSASHAREARKNLATCQACHPEGEICLTCHSAVSGLGINPHPRDWNDIKARLSDASGGKTCRTCH